MMLSVFYAILVCYGVAPCIFGLTCYSCAEYSFDGELHPSYVKRCFSMTNDTLPSKQTCALDTSTRKYYCRTYVDISDGMPYQVRRGCVSSTSDEDSTTTEMPVSDKCVAAAYAHSYSTETTSTSCYLHCNTDDCNNRSIGNFTICSSSCGREYNRGYCDYILGKCVCNSGWTGTNCSVASTVVTNVLKCVQCSSITDSTCETKKEVSDCPSNQRFCSFSEITTFNRDGNFVGKAVIKGCSTNGGEIGCRVSNIYSDNGITGRYVEHSCFWACTTHGCNADSAVASWGPALHCQQCQGSGLDCSTSSQICPANSTHCKATVTYLHGRDMYDPQTAAPSYAILKVVRECATSGVTTQCITEDFGSNITKVTCQETCQKSGCNDGWPARPKCVVCSSINYVYYGYSNTHCITSDLTPQKCSYPYQNYCIFRETRGSNSFMGLNGAYNVIRECSHHDIGSGCVSHTTAEICNKTCTTDGCNNGATGGTQNQAVVAVSYYAP